MVATPDLAIAAARARARAEQLVRPPLVLPRTTAHDGADSDAVLAQAFAADAARSATHRPHQSEVPGLAPEGDQAESQDKDTVLAPASATPSSDDTDDAMLPPARQASPSSGEQPSELPPSGSTLAPPSSQMSSDSATMPALPPGSSFAQTSSFQYQLEHFNSRSVLARTWTQEQAPDADIDSGGVAGSGDANRVIPGANPQSQALLSQPAPVYPRFNLPPLPPVPPQPAGLHRSPSIGHEPKERQKQNQSQSQPQSQPQTQTVEPGLVLPPLPILPPLPPLPPPLPVSQGTSNGGGSHSSSHSSSTPSPANTEAAASQSASQSQGRTQSQRTSRSPSAAAATTPNTSLHPVPPEDASGSTDATDALPSGDRAVSQEKNPALTPEQITAARYKAYSNGISAAKGNGGGNGTLGGTRMPRLTIALHNAYLQAAKMLPDSLVFTGMMRRDTKAAEQALRAQDTTRITADGKPIKTRRRTLPHEASVLLAFFNENQFPASFERDELSAITGMRPRAVTIWFQNRRQTEKKRQGGDASADEDTTASGARGPRMTSHDSEERPRSNSSSKSARPSGARVQAPLPPSLPPGHQFPTLAGPPPAPAFFLPPNMPLAVQQNSGRTQVQEEEDDDEEEGDLALDPLAPAPTGVPAQGGHGQGPGHWYPRPAPWGSQPMVYSNSNVGVLSAGPRPRHSLNRGALPLSARLSGSTSAPSLHHDAPASTLPRTMGLGLAPARRASARPSPSLRSTADSPPILSRRGGKEPGIGALGAASVDALVSNVPRAGPAASSTRSRTSSSPPEEEEEEEGDSQARLLARMHSSSSVPDSSFSCPSSPEKRSSSASGDETIRKRPRMSMARKTVPGSVRKTVVPPGSAGPLERIRPAHRGMLEALATASSLASPDRSGPPPASSSEEMSAVEGLLWISQRQQT